MGHPVQTIIFEFLMEFLILLILEFFWNIDCHKDDLSFFFEKVGGVIKVLISNIQIFHVIFCSTCVLAIFLSSMLRQKLNMEWKKESYIYRLSYCNFFKAIIMSFCGQVQRRNFIDNRYTISRNENILIFFSFSVQYLRDHQYILEDFEELWISNAHILG